jgi:hypothetical protein
VTWAGYRTLRTSAYHPSQTFKTHSTLIQNLGADHIRTLPLGDSWASSGFGPRGSCRTLTVPAVRAAIMRQAVLRPRAPSGTPPLRPQLDLQNRTRHQ